MRSRSLSMSVTFSAAFDDNSEQAREGSERPVPR